MNCERENSQALAYIFDVSYLCEYTTVSVNSVGQWRVSTLRVVLKVQGNGNFIFSSVSTNKYSTRGDQVPMYNYT